MRPRSGLDRARRFECRRVDLGTVEDVLALVIIGALVLAALLWVGARLLLAGRQLEDVTPVGSARIPVAPSAASPPRSTGRLQQTRAALETLVMPEVEQEELHPSAGRLPRPRPDLRRPRHRAARPRRDAGDRVPALMVVKLGLGARASPCWCLRGASARALSEHHPPLRHHGGVGAGSSAAARLTRPRAFSRPVPTQSDGPNACRDEFSRPGGQSGMGYAKDPRVDAYIDPLPAWQQSAAASSSVTSCTRPIRTCRRRSSAPCSPTSCWTGNVCALLATKDHVNLFVYDGAIVPDPHGLVKAGHGNATRAHHRLLGGRSRGRTGPAGVPPPDHRQQPAAAGAS